MAVVQRILKSLLTQDPRAYGYQAMVWTVALLCREVEKQTGESVSDSTMRRALRLVRYRHKRPRYVLTRRSPTWRQAKGGLKTA
jgi:transposase